MGSRQQPPSLPTQLEGLGSQLHDLHHWNTLYHCAATATSKKPVPPRWPQYMRYQNVSTAVHCNTVYLRCNLYTITRMCYCKKPKLSFLLECKPYVETGESTFYTVCVFPFGEEEQQHQDREEWGSLGIENVCFFFLTMCKLFNQLLVSNIFFKQTFTFE